MSTNKQTTGGSITITQTICCCEKVPAPTKLPVRTFENKTQKTQVKNDPYGIALDNKTEFEILRKQVADLADKLKIETNRTEELRRQLSDKDKKVDDIVKHLGNSINMIQANERATSDIAKLLGNLTDMVKANERAVKANEQAVEQLREVVREQLRPPAPPAPVPTHAEKLSAALALIAEALGAQLPA